MFFNDFFNLIGNEMKIGVFSKYFFYEILVLLELFKLVMF